MCYVVRFLKGRAGARWEETGRASKKAVVSVGAFVAAQLGGGPCGWEVAGSAWVLEMMVKVKPAVSPAGLDTESERKQTR